MQFQVILTILNFLSRTSDSAPEELGNGVASKNVESWHAGWALQLVELQIESIETKPCHCQAIFQSQGQKRGHIVMITFHQYCDHIS